MITIVGGDLYQWDTGRKIQITSGYQWVDFRNFGCYQAKRVLVNATSNEVTIPNSTLTKAGTCTVYVGKTNNDGTTVTVVEEKIKIHGRAKPIGYRYDDDDFLNWEKLNDIVVSNAGTRVQQYEAAAKAEIEQAENRILNEIATAEGELEDYVTAASGHATTASGYATQASGYASAASSSASSASTSATNAETAKTAAETAKTGAETAASNLITNIQTNYPTYAQVASELASQKQDLSNAGLTVDTTHTTISGKYISSSGSEKSSAPYSRTSAISVPSGTTITVTATGYLTNVAIIAEVTDSGFTKLVASIDGTNREYTYTATRDMNITVSYYTVDGLTISAVKKISDTVNSAVSAGIATISSRVTSVEENKLDKFSDVPISITGADSGHYINRNGSYATSAGFSISPHFSVFRGDVVKVTATGYLTNIAMIAKVAQSYPYEVLVLSSDSTNRTYTYTATESCELCASYSTASGCTITVKRSTDIEGIRETANSVKKSISDDKWKYAFDRVCCIGDSLTSGAYYASPFSGNSIDQNYPRILGRMLATDVKNAGSSGATPKTWYSRLRSGLNFANYGTFVIWLGTNDGLTDTIETDVTPYTDYHDFADTNTGWYCRIIEEIKESVSDAKIVLCKVFVSDDTNTVIGKIATKYSLSVIDMTDLTNANHPEWHSNAVHFNKAGNIVIADRVCQYLTGLVANGMSAEFGLTARTN